VSSWDHCGIPDPMSGGGFTHPPAERVGPASGVTCDIEVSPALVLTVELWQNWHRSLASSPLTRRQLGNPRPGPGAALTGGFFVPVALLG
jgi:hypothetical protein